MIEINTDVQNYHECTFCNDETKATRSVIFKTSPSSSHSMRMCDYHLWKFATDVERQVKKFLGERK
jgi:hypothetical protein